MIVCLYSIPATGSRFLRKRLLKNHQAVGQPVFSIETLHKTTQLDLNGKHRYIGFHLGAPLPAGMVELPELEPWILTMRDPLDGLIVRTANGDPEVVLRGWQQLVTRKTKPRVMHIHERDVSPITDLLGPGGAEFDKAVAEWKPWKDDHEKLPRREFYRQLLELEATRNLRIRDEIPQLAWFDGREDVLEYLAPYDLWWRRG